VVAAAPIHVRAVRRLVPDPLDDDDRRVLATIAGKLRTRPADLEGGVNGHE